MLTMKMIADSSFFLADIGGNKGYKKGSYKGTREFDKTYAYVDGWINVLIKQCVCSCTLT